MREEEEEDDETEKLLNEENRVFVWIGYVMNVNIYYKLEKKPHSHIFAPSYVHSLSYTHIHTITLLCDKGFVFVASNLCFFASNFADPLHSYYLSCICC